MTKPKTVSVANCFKRADAEQIAFLLRAHVPVKVEETSLILCPGAIHKRAWSLLIPTGEIRRARRILQEEGYSRFLG